MVVIIKVDNSLEIIILKAFGLCLILSVSSIASKLQLWCKPNLGQKHIRWNVNELLKGKQLFLQNNICFPMRTPTCIVSECVCEREAGVTVVTFDNGLDGDPPGRQFRVSKPSTGRHEPRCSTNGGRESCWKVLEQDFARVKWRDWLFRKGL